MTKFIEVIDQYNALHYINVAQIVDIEAKTDNSIAITTSSKNIQGNPLIIYSNISFQEIKKMIDK